MPAPKKNKFAIGNSGKPKYWLTPKELQDDIDSYFEECDDRICTIYDKVRQTTVDIKKQIPYTIEGLCETLDCDRDTLLNYEKKEGYEEYFGTIKKAKIKVQRNKLERGLDNISNPAVTIFDLKNNHGYKDKSEVEQNIKTENPLTINIDGKKLDL